MGTYAVYNVGSGEIVNRIVLDDLGAWPPPEGCALLEETSAPLRIGGRYLGGVYTSPVDPPPPPLIADPPKTKPERVAGMLKQFGLTVADLKAELGK